jgi:hypothetical protein
LISLDDFFFVVISISNYSEPSWPSAFASKAGINATITLRTAEFNMYIHQSCGEAVNFHNFQLMVKENKQRKLYFRDDEVAFKAHAELGCGRNDGRSAVFRDDGRAAIELAGLELVAGVDFRL